MGPRSNQVNLFILFFPAIIGGIFAYLSPNIKSHWDLIFVSMCVLGFFMFLYAKYKVLKTGRFFSFGHATMQPFHKIIYVMGYVLMILGLFLHLYVHLFQ